MSVSISIEPNSGKAEPSNSSSSEKPADSATVPENRWTNAFYPSPLAVHDKFSKSIVFVARCEENVADALGPNWKMIATATGKYQPFDLNMPFAIPALKYSNLERDPPLSVLGRFSAIARAKSMHHQRIKIDLILTPPSLRCVQTAAAYTSVYKRAHIIVLPDLVEPEVILENGVLTTTHGEYMNIETLRRTGLEVHESGFIDSQPLPKASETPLQAMKRIHDAIIEIISKIPGGPLLIIGDCVVLKVAETMASVPEGYLDLLADVPFKVPDLLNEAVQEMTEFDCDFTELREHYPYGSTSVFRKNRDGKLHRLQRLPVILHPVTVAPGQKQQTHLKPELTEGSQQEPVQTGSEVAVN